MEESPTSTDREVTNFLLSEAAKQQNDGSLTGEHHSDEPRRTDVHSARTEPRKVQPACTLPEPCVTAKNGEKPGVDEPKSQNFEKSTPRGKRRRSSQTEVFGPVDLGNEVFCARLITEVRNLRKELVETNAELDRVKSQLTHMNSRIALLEARCPSPEKPPDIVVDLTDKPECPTPVVHPGKSYVTVAAEKITPGNGKGTPARPKEVLLNKVRANEEGTCSLGKVCEDSVLPPQKIAQEAT